METSVSFMAVGITEVRDLSTRKLAQGDLKNGPWSIDYGLLSIEQLILPRYLKAIETSSVFPPSTK